MGNLENYSNQNETEVSATLVCCRVVEKHAEEFVTMSYVLVQKYFVKTRILRFFVKTSF